MENQRFYRFAPAASSASTGRPSPGDKNAAAAAARPAVPGTTQFRLGLGSSQPSASPTASRANRLGLGLGPSRAFGGLGKGTPSRGGGLGQARSGLKRHVKVQRDSLHGIAKNDIRRLARRGGVKRISAIVYHDIRLALRDRLALLLKDICAIIDSSGRKTVAVTDVVFALRRRGNPIYGFEPSFLRER